MKIKHIIVFCVEQGILEAQSKLLINSYLKFAYNPKIQLMAFSPRHDYSPGVKTQKFFKTNNVQHIKENLNNKYLEYPIANKILACEYAEKNFADLDSILFVDTDTIFINPLSHTLLDGKPQLMLRPVDNKGPGTTGEDDENDLFWKKVYQLYDLDLPTANLLTSVRPHIIRPYFNAGFIWANKLPGFFDQWKKDFEKIIQSELRPIGYQSRDKTDFRCLDQVALAITAQKYKNKVKILPETYNYPIPFRPLLNERAKHPKFHELIHIHYHKWFQHPDFLQHIVSDEEQKSKQYIWLKGQLPLLPKISDDYKC